MKIFLKILRFFLQNRGICRKCDGSGNILISAHPFKTKECWLCEGFGTQRKNINVSNSEIRIGKKQRQKRKKNKGESGVVVA